MAFNSFMIRTMNVIFSPITNLNPTLAIFIYAAFVSFLITLPYKFLIDHQKVKEIKEKIKELSEKMKEEQKSGNKEKVNELLAESMKLNNELMRQTFKPMMLAFIIAIIFIPWLAHEYSNISIRMPFSLPLIGNVFPFNWIGWYFISSFTLSKIFRMLLRVEL